MAGNKKLLKKILLGGIFFSAVLFIGGNFVFAGSPSGSNWFQLITSPMTSLNSDDTGDGGTGLPDDFNYYYVGQTFDTAIQINSTGTNAANIWIDYGPATVSPTNLYTGSYFPSWAGQTTTVDIPTGKRIRSTGYDTGAYHSGIGTFGSVKWNVTAPSAASYGTSTWTTFDINTGVIGLTTDSNISRDGSDIMQDAEDFNVLLWADTKKPYAKNPNPSDGLTGVAVENNFSFELRDSLRGETDDTGVGTGVNTSLPPGAITFASSGPAFSYTPSFVCSGIWGTNLCNTAVNPPSPLGIIGDTRKWEYNTTYTVAVSGFQDLASPAQNQLGDPNGPNTMNTTTWTFRTEADTQPPYVLAESPVRGSAGQPVNTNIVVDIVDKKSVNISGTGVNPATCKINVSSPTVTLVTYQQGSPEVTVTAIPYGYRFEIDPVSNFAQYETVTVSAFDCADLGTPPNSMITDTWTFMTADTDAPWVDTISPADDAVVAKNGTISFHIKDNAVVDLSNTVIYVNGVYYTQNGGPGAVTTNGTRITFASSLSFENANYVGDTTDRTGIATDYTFIIDPQTDFNDGEAIPVNIYTRDTSGNLMERYVYANVVVGAGCPTGSTFCGSNSSWDAILMKCVGTGGGTTPQAAGVSPVYLTINPLTANVVQIDSTSVLVTWHSSLAGSGRVVWDTDQPSNDYGTAPNYNYSYSTREYSNDSVYHAVTVSGLQPGKLYYFRPVTKAQGQEVRGPELVMVTKFATQYIEKTCPIVQPTVRYIRTPVQTTSAPVTTETAGQTGAGTGATTGATTGTGGDQPLKILDVRRVTNPQSELGRDIQVTGKAGAFLNLKATIY